MGPRNENAELRDRMFLDGNRISFEVPVDDDAKAWWQAEFFEKHGWTPEDVGDLLSKSWPGEKRMAVTEIDGRAKRVALRVQGSFGEGDFWLQERTLDVLGSSINADRMFISERRQGARLGRRFMRDLVEFARAIGIPTIRLDASHIGRYVWLRMVFIPDRGSWNRLKVDLGHRLFAAATDLGPERFNEIRDMIRSPQPKAARELAALKDQVTSLELFDETGLPKMVPLGRALFIEIGSNWSGELRLEDPSSQTIMDAYMKDGQ